MGAELRHRCRRCKLKLTDPTENLRSAFCCRGCHRQHYERHCLACERPMERKSGTQLVCGRRHCSTKFRELKRHNLLGRYHPSPSRRSGSADPTNKAVCEVGQERPTFRIIAGSLTPAELGLATVGAAFGCCPFSTDRKANRRHRTDADRHEVDAAGCFSEPEWIETISAGGVRCFVATDSAAIKPLSEDAA